MQYFGACCRKVKSVQYLILNIAKNLACQLSYEALHIAQRDETWVCATGPLIEE